MTIRTVHQLFDLTGKTALVTGGSRGLGLNIAQALGELGATVVISSRKAAELEAATTQLTGQGLKVSWIAADSSKDAEIARLAAEAIARLGHIDILVNNAGATWGAPAEEHPVEGWDKVMGVNIRGLFLLTQIVGRDSMLPRGRGSIVNIASIAGLGGNPPFMKTIAYNTSKGACITFTQALAAEWGPRGIRVNAIAPGPFVTNIGGGWLKDPVVREAWDKSVPLGRIADTYQIKPLALYLASDASSYVTGSHMLIDGGMALGKFE